MARNVWQNADKLLSRIRRTDSLDWREFNFFKPGVGLSRHDQLSIRVCLDYELARQWLLLVELLANCSEKKRQDVLFMPESRRFARAPYYSADLPLLSLLDDPDMPPVPTVCIAASWFPAPWLSGPARERDKIVEKLAQFYNRTSWTHNTSPLSKFAPAMENRQVERLIEWARKHRRTLHVFAINRRQTKSAIIAAFKEWIERQPDISGKQSRRGKIKPISELRDLGCYRLMTKLEPLSRQVAMDEADFKQSMPKLSEAKRRTQRRLRVMGYI
jgi:hypothetical protein